MQQDSLDPSTAFGVVYADSARATRAALCSTVLIVQNLSHAPALVCGHWLRHLVRGCLVHVDIRAGSRAPLQVNWQAATTYHSRTLRLGVERITRQVVNAPSPPLGSLAASLFSHSIAGFLASGCTPGCARCLSSLHVCEVCGIRAVVQCFLRSAVPAAAPPTSRFMALLID